MKKLIPCILLALAACSNTSDIEDAVRESLVDPDSAKFGEIVEYTEKEGGERACVMVNAKNRMGGYTGESIVMAMKDKEGVWRSLGEGPDSWDCKKYIEVMNTDT